MSAEQVITTRALTKRFGHVVAVDRLDLRVGQGERYGFLGPNGSGKTTTVRMLLGLVFATSGEVEVLGRPVPRHGRDVLGQVGALVEGPAAYPHLSARLNLRLIDAAGGQDGSRQVSRATRRRRIEDALEQVGLADVGRRPVGAFSLGMRQRLGLAQALVRAPRLLVLDEPTNGLDPLGIHETRELLLSLNAAGTTVFLSSHLLAEVELLCTHVGVLHHGRLVAQDELSALRGPTGRTAVQVDDGPAARRLFGAQVVGGSEDRLLLQGIGVPDATARLVRAGIGVLEAVAERRTLEQTVLELTS